MPSRGKHRPDKLGSHVPTHEPARVDVALLFQEEIADDVWCRLENAVTPEERAKAARFVFPADRRACLAAHWLKRQMLSRADPTTDLLSWRFDYGPHGKPQIAGRSDLHFNLSHCHGLVACAVRRDGPVGIDVEFTSRPAPAEIVAHYFSAAEAAWWRVQPDSEKTRAFFALWTLKEAFIKATGEGLRRSLQDFTVCVDRLALLPQGELASQAQSWRFYQAEPGNQHLLALAWRKGGGREERVDTIIVRPDVWA
jgi:4'-phosphopantetheinyl transferase